MFIGHFAVGFGARARMSGTSLGVLFVAAQFADLVWPNLVLAGLEQVEVDPGNTAFTPLDFVAYPYSHSLVAIVLWAAAVGLVYAFSAGQRMRTAVVVGLVVVSHWVLDAISHRPDLPLTVGGTTRVGLGLWNSVPATIAVEVAMFAIGLALYLRATRARDRVGSVGLASLVVFLLAIYVANVFGPPPPSATAVAIAAEALWLVVLWAFWVDRHREVRPAAAGVR